MVKWIKVLYVPQSVKNLLSISRIVSKGATIGDTKDKMTIKKNDINMILDERKVIHESIMVNLKEKRFAPKVSSPQE